MAQDTGSGGSWPISSDRVVWIHAAVRLLPLLDRAAAADWEQQVYRTATDTLAQERRHAFDAASGLYRGETSFLDWREQTYPDWTRNDTLAIASSYALSTNVLHYLALLDTAWLAARQNDRRAADYGQQAQALGKAILRHFRAEGSDLYASYLFRDLAPVDTYDLLGLALLAESGLLDEPSIRRMLGAYPLGAGGPPVIWPERADVPIYHNRAVWPFVTAYALRAAERAHDAAHASAYARSMLQGVAVALSNQENAEFLTLSPSFADGALSGPVINSESQLWSVTAMLDLVVRSVFGVQVERDGIRIAPSFPAALTGRVPEAGSVWTLTGLPLGNGHTTLRLHFPAKLAAQDWLEARSVRLDGLAWEMTKTLDPDHLPQQVDIELGARAVAPTTLVRLEVSDPHHPTDAERAHLYAPPAPLIDAIADNGGRVKIAVGGVLAGHDWALWRDGAKVGTGHGTLATDHLAPNHGAVCYTLRQHAPRGLTSLPSAERCLPAAEGTIEVAAVDADVRTTGPASRLPDPPRLALWGAPDAQLRYTARIRRGGHQRLSVAYRNDGRINTGVTAAVKAVTITCNGHETHDTLVLPQLGDALRRGRSTPVEFEADAGSTCEVVLTDGLNMSYLTHFRHYTAGRGGSDGPANTADLLALRIEPVEPSGPTKTSHSGSH